MGEMEKRFEVSQMEYTLLKINTGLFLAATQVGMVAFKTGNYHYPWLGLSGVI